jgi:hypothetical protein
MDLSVCVAQNKVDISNLSVSGQCINFWSLSSTSQTLTYSSEGSFNLITIWSSTPSIQSFGNFVESDDGEFKIMESGCFLVSYNLGVNFNSSNQIAYTFFTINNQPTSTTANSFALSGGVSDMSGSQTFIGFTGSCAVSLEVNDIVRFYVYLANYNNPGGSANATTPGFISTLTRNQVSFLKTA